AVGDLLRERVLKGVFELRKEARLIEKFGSVQVGQRPTQGLLGERGDGLQQREGDVLADDCRRLQEGLLLGRESVPPGSEDRLDGGRYLNGPECLRQTIGPRLAHQDLALHERPDTLLQEEGIPFGALDQRVLERLKGDIVAKEGLEESYGAGGR